MVITRIHHQWGVSPRTTTVFTTWSVMSGNGVTTDMVPAIMITAKTLARYPVQTQQGLSVITTVCFGGAVGTALPTIAA